MRNKQHQMNVLEEKLDKLRSGMLHDIKYDNTIYKETTNKLSGMKHTHSKLSMSDINKEISQLEQKFFTKQQDFKKRQLNLCI